HRVDGVRADARRVNQRLISPAVGSDDEHSVLLRRAESGRPRCERVLDRRAGLDELGQWFVATALRVGQGEGQLQEAEWIARANRNQGVDHEIGRASY